MINNKKTNLLLFTILISYICTILFWNILNLENSLTPYLDNHNSNIEKYNNKYSEISTTYISDVSFSLINYFKLKLDIGYDLLTLFFKILGLNFEQFLFFSIFIAYVVYISIFSSITSSKNWLIYFVLLIFSSFWLSFSLGGAVRQGLAMIFLLYFLFNFKNFTYTKAIFVILTACTIHLSAIIFIPYLIFEKIFINRIKLTFYIFLLITLLYVFNLNLFISDIIVYLANLLEFDLRALNGYRDNHPTAGFSMKKLLATIIPVIAFIFSNYFPNKNSFNTQEKRIYLYYIFPAMVGMSLSHMSYYDRILLYSWTWSPILLTFFFFKLYPFFINIIGINIKRRD